MAGGAWERLHPKVQRWLWMQGWSSLRPVQENSIPLILSEDRDVIIGAPTAGGKTEAAFLPILSQLAEKPVSDSFAVLYISPLKALINDQTLRLQQMCASLDIDVTPWHGDVAATKKHVSLAKPSGILIITPESLESLFVNHPHKLESALRGLRYVVVDELHAFMGLERGKQLQSLMSRIEHLVGRKLPRIAMSATFSDYELAKNALRPGRDFPCDIPDAANAGHDTRILLKEYISSPELDATRAITQDIYLRLRGSNNLVFANSRKEAETLTLALKDRCEQEGVPNEFQVHHGSLSKQARESLERQLRIGTFPVTAVCTTTLELGIDIGKVASVAQLGVVNSVTGLRQRLGRSGRRGQPSVVRIYSVDEKRDDYKYHLRVNLVQNIASIELMRNALYESPNIDNPHFSTLIQQILSVTAQFGSVYPNDLYNILCRDGAFRNVSTGEFLHLLKHLGTKEILAMMDSGQLILGKVGEVLVRKLDFYTAFVTLKDWNVINKSTGKIIGSIQYKPYVGEYFLLAGQRWLVESIDDRGANVYVNQAATTGKLMFEGFGAEVDGMITRMMKRIYMSDETYPYLDKSLGAEKELQLARAYFHELQLDKKEFVEIGGTSLYFTWGGMRHNRRMALLLSDDRESIPSYDPFAIADVTPVDLRRMQAADPDITEIVARRLTRSKKAFEKYDLLLPDDLLDRQYITSNL